MNKEWSEKNKKMQSLIGKKDSFADGIAVLFELREELFGQITSIVDTYPQAAFCRSEGVSQQDACVFPVAYIPD